MQEITITRPGVVYYDGGKTHRPDAGAVVQVLSPSVVRSLLKAGWAVAGRVAVPPTGAVMAPLRVAPSSLGADAGPAAETAERATWVDVEGISEPSLNLLMKNAPSADPLTAGPEDLFLWLESRRRATYVIQALQRFREARSAGSDGP